MTLLNVRRRKAHSWHRCPTRLKAQRLERNVFLAILLVGSLASIGDVTAQSFTTIYSFSPPSYFTNDDGAGSFCTPFLSQNILYGTAAVGGASGKGTIFKLKTDGSGFTTLHSFSSASDVLPINSDGITPKGGVTLSGTNLYGTAFQGGSSGSGTVFSVGTNGDNFQTLYSFSVLPPSQQNSDGAKPLADLVVSGNVIYGSTFVGGPTGGGTLFRIDTNGSGFTVFDSLTNLDGGPQGVLVLSNNVLYGTTFGGGSSNNGTVFSINVDGTGLKALYSFTGGSDGAQPIAGLLLYGNVIYGTTTGGGASGQGTVFKLNIDGTSFATLHSFTNAEGTPNLGSLVLLGHNLFGVASYGLQGGTVYSLSTNGTGFAVIHSFTGGLDGGLPQGGLAGSGSTLYGTTSKGGTVGSGTVFSFSLLPHLAIIASGQNVILTWPTNYAGFDYSGYTLQSTTNLVSPVWNTNLPAPVVVNGQNTVTNPISGTLQFFRLSQ